jgi:predicted nucleotidyltransferase
MLFKTVHGSHLYGLAHAQSDNDFYTVLDRVPKKRALYAKQKISSDGTDSMVVDFGTWLGMCQDGVPQALEAMFSSKAIYDDIAEFRASYHVGTTAHERFLRTIKSFAVNQDYKRKRHGLRLALNFYDMSRNGRYDPTLTPNQVDFVTDVAHKDTDVVYAYCMNIALDRMPPGMVR